MLQHPKQLPGPRDHSFDLALIGALCYPTRVDEYPVIVCRVSEALVQLGIPEVGFDHAGLEVIDADELTAAAVELEGVDEAARERLLLLGIDKLDKGQP